MKRNCVCTNQRKIKKNICGIKGRVSVTNCGIGMRKKKRSAYKKINANKQCKQTQNGRLNVL